MSCSQRDVMLTLSFWSLKRSYESPSLGACRRARALTNQGCEDGRGLRIMIDAKVTKAPWSGLRAARGSRHCEAMPAQKVFEQLRCCCDKAT
jgi:hypothetical protein